MIDLFSHQTPSSSNIAKREFGVLGPGGRVNQKLVEN